jgi:hypothetical protein
MPVSRLVKEPFSSFCVVTARDGGVVLDIKGDRLLKLNRTGAQIWKLLEEGETESQIVAKIAGRFGVDQNRVATDVRALLEKFAALRVSPGSSV